MYIGPKVPVHKKKKAHHVTTKAPPPATSIGGNAAPAPTMRVGRDDSEYLEQAMAKRKGGMGPC